MTGLGMSAELPGSFQSSNVTSLEGVGHEGYQTFKYKGDNRMKG